MTPSWRQRAAVSGSSIAAAPRKASRASSSPDTICTCSPVPAAIASTSAAPLEAVRIAAVATPRISAAPCSRATASWRSTTDTTSSILSAPIAPDAARPLPILVKARSW